MSIFRYYFDIAFPWEYQYERRQPKSGWVTQGIRMSSKRMRHLNSLSKQQNLTEHMKLYIARYKTLYRKVIREAKRRENDHYILQAHNKSKATWRIIHKETGRASPQGQDIILVKNNEEVTNPGRVAETLNSYFCEIPKELLEVGGIQRPIHGNYHLKINQNPNSMFLHPVTENKLKKVAGSLKNKLTAGLDDVPEYVIKQCIDQLTKPLTDIYNASLESGIFPDKLKIAKVIPVHKKGGARDVSNYRPISLLPVFAKLLEKLMYNRLTEFMDRNEILTEEQHGFRTKKSTDMALQSFTKRVQEAIDKKMNPIGIFLDLTKAYDVLSHKVLLSKLDTYGIRGVANKWFKSYLSLRKQCVEINSKQHRTVVTATRDIMNGVPQGSTLGPHIIPAIHK